MKRVAKLFVIRYMYNVSIKAARKLQTRFMYIVNVYIVNGIICVEIYT